MINFIMKQLFIFVFLEAVSCSISTLYSVITECLCSIYIHEGINNSFSWIYNKLSAYMIFNTQLISIYLIVNRFLKVIKSLFNLILAMITNFPSAWWVQYRIYFILDVNLFFKMSVCVPKNWIYVIPNFT